MIQRRWFAAAALLLAACGGGSGGAAAVHPANTASAAVENFMKAVADSNLAAMAGLWGTAKGPAARTRQPSDYERRIVGHAELPQSRRLPDPRRCARGVRGPPYRPGPDPAGRLHLDDSLRSSSSSPTAAGSSTRWTSPRPAIRPAPANPRPRTRPAPLRDAGELSSPPLLLCYSVSSSRMPAVAFGWTKAIRRPPAPVRGTSSIRR